MAKPRKNPLEIGSVIRTNPSEGFWGCAVVLSAYDGTAEHYPVCHIGVTDFISTKIYDAAELDFSRIEMLTYESRLRVAPFDYVRMPTRRCIGIYTVMTATRVDVITTIDPTDIYDRPLTMDIGDGTNGAYPLCGPVPDYLGQEAVVAWRRVHDKERLAEEERESSQRFEVFEEQRLEEARKKRKQ